MSIRHLFISVVISSTLASCNGSGKHEQEQLSLMEASRQELASAVEERDQLLALVKDISLGISQIRQLENIMTIAAECPNENNRQKKQILSDIASIKRSLQQRKEQLKQLEEKLQQSTLYTESLQETINALHSQIDSQTAEIESLRKQLNNAAEKIGTLNQQVDSLNLTVATVEGERDAAHEASVRLENELNTCYFVIAQKSDLKEHNIIESGFLRKTKLLKGDFDKGFFVISDKRTLQTLPLGEKKVKILTNHPETSYKIDEQPDGQKVLTITDSVQFWNLTNYLVIQTD